MKISSRFDVKEVVGAFVGVELEVEGENLPGYSQFAPGTAWEVKQDGSLRGGLEYVFREPLGAVKGRQALTEIGDVFTRTGTKTEYSFRCSTHIHVNVSNLEIDVVRCMVAAFHLFEDEYLNYCAKHRRGNRFCLGMKDADGVVSNLRSFFNSARVPTGSGGKYSALNLVTLSRFGTLEFRCLEGTDNWERIYTWIRALLALRKAAKDIADPKQLLNMPVEELAKMLFPTERLRNTFLKEGWEGRVALNRSVGFDAFYSLERA